MKGQGYAAARYGVATSDTPFGPFKFVRSGRVNPGIYPIGFSKRDTTYLKHQLLFPELKEWWTPAWRKQIERGMFWMRDFQGGQMSRDMTIFIDDDGKAYHIYSSEENLTLQIAQLTDDYMQHNGSYVRVAAGGHNVDSSKVIERYYKSINNIKELLDICDIMHVYDNTKSPERIIRKHKEELSIYPNEYWSEQDILGLME